MKIAVRLALTTILIGSGLTALSAHAQTIVSLDAGSFTDPTGVAVDASGNVFIADAGDGMVKEILASSGYATVQTLAPTNGNFNHPQAIAVDGNGNVFIADTYNNAVKEILAAGGYVTVNTLAAANGDFSLPEGVAVDGNGNVFVADWGNSAVKEIVSAGNYTTVDTLAQANGNFSFPGGVAVDGSGNVFVADTYNNAVKEILAAGGYVTVATLGTANGGFAGPQGVAVDGDGNVFVGDTVNNAVKEILAAGGYVTVNTLATANGKFDGPVGIALDGSGALFVADSLNDQVKQLAMPSPIAAAVLPGARSVQTGTVATVFATMINASTADLQSCGAALPVDAPAGLSLSFQTTNPSTNALTGTLNQPVTIPANGVQTFLLAFQSSTALTAPVLPPRFSCQGTPPAAPAFGIDTVDLTFSAGPIADIIALAATASQDGTLHLANGVGAFAVATIDDGAAANLVASVDTGAARLPLSLALCQTDTTGQCVGPLAPSVPVSFAANGAPTFSIFASTTGQIPFAPGASRVFVRFSDSGGLSHGSTSVAVTTG